MADKTGEGFTIPDPHADPFETKMFSRSNFAKRTSEQKPEMRH